MKIAELFVSLGFKIEGRAEFDAVAARLDQAATDSRRLAAGVDAVTSRLAAAATAAEPFLKATRKVVAGLKKVDAEASKTAKSLAEANAEVVKTADAAAKVPPPLLKVTKITSDRTKEQVRATETVKRATKSDKEQSKAQEEVARSTGKVAGGFKSSLSELKKLTVWVDAATAGLFYLADTAARSGASLRNFSVTTGLAPEEVQRWQYTAAAFNVSIETIRGSLEALNKTRGQFALGEPSNVGVWSWLGVDPTHDPFTVITELRRTLTSGQKNPAVVQELIGRLGLEGLLPLLKSSEQEFEKWKQSFVIPSTQIEKLARLRAQIAQISLSAAAARDRILVALAPALERLLTKVEPLLERLADFAEWLGGNSAEAEKARKAIVTLVVALAAFAATLTLVTGALTALSTLFNPVTAAIAWLVVTVGRLWSIVKSTYDLLEWGRGFSFVAKDVDLLTHALNGLIGMWGRLTKGTSKTASLFDFAREAGSGFPVNTLGAGRVLFDALKRHFQDNAIGATPSISPAAVLPSTPASPSIRQDVKVDMKIDGSRDPVVTGRVAARSLGEELNLAYRQAPVPTR